MAIDDKTMHFTMDKDGGPTPKEIIMTAYNAMIEKGYNPVNQFVGYFTSGDPTYITSHNNARALMRRLERNDFLEEVIGFYLANNV